MSQRVINVSAMTSGHWSLEHLVVPTDANLSAVLLCHTGNISARYKHCMIALPISTIIITDVSASCRRLGDDQVPSVFRASCSVDRCESLGGLTLSHREYLSIIQALHDCITNQHYNDYRCLGDDQWPSVFRASCSADRCKSLGSRTLSHGEYPSKIKASQDSIVNQAYHCHTCLGEDISADQLPNDYMCRRVIDISAMTGDHWSLGHLVALTNVNLSAVLLCHTMNILARYRHGTIALPISAT